MHGSHTVAPSVCWKVPAAHLSHDPMPVLGATVPGLHCVGTADPVEQKEPGWHMTQSAALVIEMLSSRIVAFWCVPMGQGRAALAASAQ